MYTNKTELTWFSNLFCIFLPWSKVASAWKGLNGYCGTFFRVVELTGDVTPDMWAVAKADLQRVK